MEEATSKQKLGPPKGYRVEESTELGASIAIPKSWVANKPSATAVLPKLSFRAAVPGSPTRKPGIVRNVTLTADPMPDIHTPPQQLYDESARAVAGLLRDAELMREEQTVLLGLPAVKRVFHWRPMDAAASLYQVGIVSKGHRRVYWINCTAEQRDFKAARPTFDTIINSFRFLDIEEGGPQ
jgi:hypothetical protein